MKTNTNVMSSNLVCKGGFGGKTDGVGSGMMKPAKNILRRAKAGGGQTVSFELAIHAIE